MKFLFLYLLEMIAALWAMKALKGDTICTWASFLVNVCLVRKNQVTVGKNAVTVICRHSCGREVVGHVPQDIAKVVLLYLSLPHFYLELEVTGKHVNHEGGYGLEILARFCLYRPEKATQWLETRLTKIEQQ